MDSLISAFTSPAAALTYVFVAGINGFVSNRVDALLWDRLRSFTNRPADGFRPFVNHDVQRAIRVSFIHATLDACEQYEKELRTRPQESDTRRHWGFRAKSDEERWLRDVLWSLDDDLRQLRSNDYVPPETVPPSYLQWLLKPWKACTVQ